MMITYRPRPRQHITTHSISPCRRAHRGQRVRRCDLCRRAACVTVYTTGAAYCGACGLALARRLGLAALGVGCSDDRGEQVAS